MADRSAYRRNAEPPISEEDPFAELTRIMGFDPRVKVTPNPEPEPDFGIDLERELLGELEHDFPAQASAKALPVPPVVTNQPDQQAFTNTDDDAADLSDVELSDALDMALWEQDLAQPEPQVAEDADTEIPDFELSAEDLLADAESGRTDPQTPSDSHSSNVSDRFEAPDNEVWLNQPAISNSFTEATTAPAAKRPSSESISADDAVFDLDLEFSEEELAFLPDGQSDFRPDDEIDPHEPAAFGRDLDPHPVYDYAGTPAPLENDDPVPQQVIATAQRDAEEAWTSYDPNLMPVSDEPDMADFVLSEDETSASQPQASAAPAQDHSMDEPAMQTFDERAFDAALAEELNEPESPPHPHEWSRTTPMPAATRSQVEDSWARPRAAVNAPPMQADVPAIETVDFVENRVAHSDELDLPVVEYVPEPTRRTTLDDFDEEFTSAYHALNEAPPAQRQAAFARQEPPRQPNEFASGYGDDEFGYDPATDAPGTSALARAGMYDPQDEYEEFSRYNQRATPIWQRRSFKIGGAIAALVLVMGVGMLAFSGETTEDGTALVRADSDPIKVRPENPGGATVPNQENVVYNRVGSDQPLSPPTQERLIDTAEEPVDLIPPQSDTPLEGLAALGDGGKGEDRLDIDQVIEANATPEEMVAVPPRRVRTMIVKPDGSLVAREEPAAAEDTSMQVAALAEDEPTGTIAQAMSEPTIESVEAQAAESAPPVEQAPGVAAPVEETETTIAAVQPEVAPPAAAASTPSAWSVQISSQPNAEAAQQSYDSLARRYSSVLGGKGVNIVRADIAGKGTYFRVRIPAETRSAANEICSDYKAAGGSCFVTQ